MNDQTSPVVCLSAGHVVVTGWENEEVLIVGYTEEPPRKRRRVTDEGVCGHICRRKSSHEILFFVNLSEIKVISYKSSLQRAAAVLSDVTYIKLQFCSQAVQTLMSQSRVG